MIFFSYLDTHDKFTKYATGCILNDFTVKGVYHLYVEMTLSSCKYLCQFLDDYTCTLIVFLPNARSCIFLPWQTIRIGSNSKDCEWIELHYRHRERGEFPLHYLNGLWVPVETAAVS